MMTTDGQEETLAVIREEVRYQERYAAEAARRARSIDIAVAALRESGMTQAEIARELGWSRQGVSQRLARHRMRAKRCPDAVAFAPFGDAYGGRVNAHRHEGETFWRFPCCDEPINGNHAEDCTSPV